jgi:ERI1 exoribonuclease 2
MAAPTISPPVSHFSLQELSLGPRYVVVIDLEGTCDVASILHRIQPREIIQIGAVVVDLKPSPPKLLEGAQNQFEVVVRPEHHPKLSTFCVALTKITQEQIDTEGVIFAEAMLLFHRWLKQCLKVEAGRYEEECTRIGERAIFMTLGQWDLGEEIPLECARRRLPVPTYMRRWLDLQRIAKRVLRFSYMPGIESLMTHLKLPMQGRLHSALADSINTAAILIRVMTPPPASTATTAEASASSSSPAPSPLAPGVTAGSSAAASAAQQHHGRSYYYTVSDFLQEHPFVIDNSYIEGVVLESHLVKEKARKEKREGGGAASGGGNAALSSSSSSSSSSSAAVMAGKAASAAIVES